MKPILLQISGWGPYKGLEKIDFGAFQKRGLFLITGPTGAGKTTIFDAITYALYGNVSGSMREKSSVRSDFALADTKTFVELTFSHNGKEYRIYRNPEYMRPKKRKTGEEAYTREKENAILFLPDETAVEGNQEVTKRVQEILRMDYRQFKQISMIAQGEFTKLLTANQREKTEIFREIFDTFFYERFSAVLKKKTSGLYAEIMTYHNKMDETIDGISLPNEEKFSELTQGDKYAYETILEYLMEKKKEQVKEIKEQKRQIKEIQAKMDSLLTETEKAKQINLLFMEEEKAKEEYGTLKQQEMEIKEKKCVQKQGEKAQRLELFELAYRQIREQEAEAEQKEKKLETEIADCEKQIAKTECFWEQKTVIEEVLALGMAGSEKQFLLCQKEKAVSEKEKELLHAKAVYVTFEKEMTEKKQAYQQADLQYKRAIVGIVANMVVEGQPCPVCGSMHHPNVATLTEEVRSEEELEQLKESYEKANEEFLKLYENAGKLAGEVEAERTTLAIWEEEQKQTEANVNELYISLQKLCKNRSVLPQLPKQWDKSFWEERKHQFDRFVLKQKENKVILEEKKKRYTECKQEKEKLQVQKTEKEAEWRQKLSEAGYPSYEAYQKDKLSLEELEGLREEIATYEKKETAQRDYWERTKKALVGKKQIERKSLEEEYEILSQKKKTQEQRLSRVTIEEASVVRACDSLQSKIKEVKILEKQYGIYGDLDNMTSGKNAKRLVFEQYVLMSYFDSVLRAANLRFAKMTSGRYEIFRAEGTRDGRTKDNLEMDILDHYTGKYRSIKTLSGGESFKASLALALGLSDVIQMTNGGILVETLFVDEGFGALDSESLEQACETLMSLVEKDHLIGIVSHVPELKERIESQLVIEKTNCGSTVSVVI